METKNAGQESQNPLSVANTWPWISHDPRPDGDELQAPTYPVPLVFLLLQHHGLVEVALHYCTGLAWKYGIKNKRNDLLQAFPPKRQITSPRSDPSQRWEN